MAETNDKAGTVNSITIAAFGLTSLIGLVVVGTACYLWIVGREVPQGLGVLLTASVTYIFTTLPAIVTSFLNGQSTPRNPT